MRIGPDLRPVEGEMRKRKNIKKAEQKSQNRDTSPPCGGAICEPISIKFGVFAGLTDVVAHTKIVWIFLIVFPGRKVEKRMFPCGKPTAYNIAMRYRAGLWSLRTA